MNLDRSTTGFFSDVTSKGFTLLLFDGAPWYCQALAGRFVSRPNGTVIVLDPESGWFHRVSRTFPFLGASVTIVATVIASNREAWPGLGPRLVLVLLAILAGLALASGLQVLARRRIRRQDTVSRLLAKIFEATTLSETEANLAQVSIPQSALMHENPLPGSRREAFEGFGLAFFVFVFGLLPLGTEGFSREAGAWLVWCGLLGTFVLLMGSAELMPDDDPRREKFRRIAKGLATMAMVLFLMVIVAGALFWI